MARGQAVVDGYLEPAGFARLDDLSTAVGLVFPDNVKLTLIQAEGGSLRWRDDGIDPTDTVGMLLADGVTLAYTGDVSAIKLIEVSSATANVSFYR